MAETTGLPDTIQQTIQAIAADRQTGASGLARLGGEALLALLTEIGGSPELPRLLAEGGRRLVAAQPTMAPLFHLANGALLAWEKTHRPAAVEEAVRSFLAGLEESIGRVAAHAAATLEGEGVVLTHSHSRTVVEALCLAHRQGARLYVLCTESRPLLEGREVASVLAAAGIPVTLLIDAAGPGAAIQEATAVWLGADSVAREGLYNKVGSYALALAAQEAGVPCYALADRSKFWPDGRRRRPAVADRDPLEVWEKIPAGTAVRNRYFDCTPLDWLGAAIAEDGALSPEQVEQRLAGLPVHPNLEDY